MIQAFSLFLICFNIASRVVIWSIKDQRCAGTLLQKTFKKFWISLKITNYLPKIEWKSFFDSFCVFL
jgi:hypothetical protein